MGETLTLRPGAATLDDLRPALQGPVTVSLPEGTGERIDAGQQVILDAVENDQVVYAVNTGFGKLASVRIDKSDLIELQRRLILSHMTGVGPLLPDEIVREVLALKVLCLAQGHSGVRRVVVDNLLALLNADVLPCIPAQGSCGASGDLAPLAHLAGVLMGTGTARVDGEELDAVAALARAGIEPLQFGPKEGVGLINGTQVSTALALAGLFEAERVFRAALAAGALSLEGVAGTNRPFDPRIQEIRRQEGQKKVAAALAALTADSPIRTAEMPGRRLQDPYSFRCQPQVMGAALDLLDFAGTVLGREANAVSDNPLVFPDDGEVLSGGNFHAQPVAYAADVIAMALCEIGALSERRTAMLNDASMSGLPPFLVANAGLNSGMMLGQVTCAALVAENRMLSHPASVDSLPTVANQEDHVSMATHGAR
ncbi:MAG TPA: histidine ammonia-lyase, partial [Candidatus Binatia bacterium]|nr:histidine ammonia-lyase [Candidatus Binatia bacterium]